jgi:hypothetical protein
MMEGGWDMRIQRRRERERERKEDRLGILDQWRKEKDECTVSL